MTSAKQIQWESLGRHEDSVGGGTSPSELRRVVNMMKRLYKYVVNQLKVPMKSSSMKKFKGTATSSVPRSLRFDLHVFIQD